MKIFCSLLSIVMLAAAGPAFGEWPERGLTLVTSNPRTATWSQDEPDIRARLLESLIPRLSRELGVPVSLIFRPAGSGVLAGNMVAEASSDGYIFGALGGDAAMGRVIQEFTPYSWSEFVPVATAWRTVYAVVVRADEKADGLRGIFQTSPGPRLAHTGLNPIETPTLIAIRAAQAAGFSWEFTKVEALDPGYLLRGEVDAMVLPLGNLHNYPERGQIKVLTVLVKDDGAPCAAGLPNLGEQGIDIELNPPFAFYLPSKVNWRIRSRLSQALSQALAQPNVIRAMTGACLEPLAEDIDGISAALEQEYRRQESVFQDMPVPETL